MQLHRSNRLAWIAVVGALVFGSWVSPASAQLPFFPGAEGYGGSFLGTAPSGGWFSNADVYRVTTTEDILVNSKGAPGTLRGAFIDHSNPNSPKQKVTNRIVVFDVGGTFRLTHGKLDIKEVNNIYIAGQTAPSPVTVYGNMSQITKSNDTVTSNVVLRYMSFRKGDGPEQDSLSFTGGDGPNHTVASNMILDHVTTSWSEDENLSVANNNTNITVQYSIIHDALVSNHAYGSLIRPRVDSQVTFHHNLYANNSSRQARFGTYHAATLTADFRNNVVYNWRDRASYAGGSSESAREYADVNFVGNYFIAGPGTLSNTTKTFMVDQNIDARVYQSGNFVDSDKQLNPGGQPNGSDTGWGMFQVSPPPSNPSRVGVLTQMAAPFSTDPVTTQTADAAYWQIINHVGNWWWDRDAIDSRVISNVMNNTNAPNGIAASSPPAPELNGLLNAPQTSHPAGWDSDGDGMPDWWEVKHGLNPNNANDWKLDFDNDGYINLVEYVNERGEFPATAPIVFNGGTNNRYAQIMNWKTHDGITTGSFWQPSKYDEAQINSGTVVVDSVGQHAGLLILGNNPGNNATLNITNGWLHVEGALVIGGDDSATATLNLSGGILVTPVLAKGAGGTFNFTGGTLHAETIGFDLQNSGGTFSLGGSIGTSHVMGDLTLNGGTLQIEIGSASLADALMVDGAVTLGGALDISLLGGFTPNEGDHWEIINSGEGITQQFSSITPGYSLLHQGDSLFLYFGAAPAGLDGDFNSDGVVDAADYVVWRQSGGSAEDFAAWRSNFGAVVSGTGGMASVGHAAIPEPAAFLLLVLGSVVMVNSRHRETPLT